MYESEIPNIMIYPERAVITIYENDIKIDLGKAPVRINEVVACILNKVCSDLSMITRKEIK